MRIRNETQNMIGVLQETEQTADNTAVELTNQREQLGRITEDAIEIDSLLTRADRLVKVFSKRMMTDKVQTLDTLEAWCTPKYSACASILI